MKDNRVEVEIKEGRLILEQPELTALERDVLKLFNNSMNIFYGFTTALTWLSVIHNYLRDDVQQRHKDALEQVIRDLSKLRDDALMER